MPMLALGVRLLPSIVSGASIASIVRCASPLDAVAARLGDDHELVAAQPRDEAFAQCAGQPFGQPPQQFVADGWPSVSLIDLKSSRSTHSSATDPPPRFARAKLMLEMLEEQGAVWEAR